MIEIMVTSTRTSHQVQLARCHAVRMVQSSRALSVGHTVRLDKSGFIRAIEAAETGSHTESVSGPSRDQTITRLPVLKAAAEFAASRPDIKSSDVLRIAEVWEQWIAR